MANIKGGRIEYTVGYTVDQSSLRALQQELTKIKTMTTKDFLKINPQIDTRTATQQLRTIQDSARAVERAMTAAYNPKLNITNLTKLNAELKSLDISKIYNDFSRLGAEGQKAFTSFAASALATNTTLKKTPTLVDKVGDTLKKTLTWNLSSSVINQLTGKFQEAYGYVQHLDSSLNDIRIVTGKSADEMDKFAEKANKAAKALGKSTTDYTNASLIYYQQGLSDEETAARTDVTLKAANVTQQSTAEVSEQLTAVWNGYKVSADEAELYVDKLAAVAAATASDLEELSTGMSKVASAANLVGMDVDQMNAALATTISVTRQAPETVGTAYKTILARMTTIAAGGEDEGATLTSYTEDMNAFGINVLDATGHLRDMGDVVEEVGAKWSTMSKEAQISLAQTMAGTRQYNNLTALFDNWDMYQKALRTSQSSAGTLQEQQEIYMESVAAHLQQLQTASEGVMDSILDSDTIITFADALTTVAEKVEVIIDGVGNLKGLIATLASVMLGVYNKKIGESMATVISNFQKQRKEAQMFKEDIENTKVFAQSAGMSSEGTKALVDNIEKLQRYYSVATEGEINKGKELAKNIALAKEEQKIQEDNLRRAQNTITSRFAYSTQKEREKVNQINLAQGNVDVEGASIVQNVLEGAKRTTEEATGRAGAETPEVINASTRAVLEYKQAMDEVNAVLRRRNATEQERNAAEAAQTRAQNTYNRSLERERDSILSITTAYQEYLTADKRAGRNTRDQDRIAASVTYTKALNAERESLQKLLSYYNSQDTNGQNQKDIQQIQDVIDAIDAALEDTRDVLDVGNTNPDREGLVEGGRGYLLKDSVESTYKDIEKLKDTLSSLAEEQDNVAEGLSGEIHEAIAQADTDVRNFNQENEQLTENLELKTFTANLTSVFSLVSSGIAIFQTLGATIRTLGDDTASSDEKMQSFLVLLGMVGTQAPLIISQFSQASVALRGMLSAAETYLKVLPFVIKNIKGLKTEEAAKNLVQGASITLTEAETVAVQKLGLAINKYLLPVALAVAAITAWVVAYKQINKALHETDKMLEDSSRRVDEAKEAYQNITNEVNDLASSLDDLGEKKDHLSELTKGTEEWDEALKDVQDSVEALLEKYPELYKYARYENGGWTISDEDLEAFQQEKEKEANQAKVIYLGSQISEKETAFNEARDTAIKSATGGLILNEEFINKFDAYFKEVSLEQLKNLRNDLKDVMAESVSGQLSFEEMSKYNPAYYDYYMSISDVGKNQGLSKEELDSYLASIIDMKQKELEYDELSYNLSKQMLDLDQGGRITESLQTIFGDNQEALENVKEAILSTSSSAYYKEIREKISDETAEKYKKWTTEEQILAVELYRKQLEQTKGTSVTYDASSQKFSYQKEGEDEATVIKLKDVQSDVRSLLINQKTLEAVVRQSIDPWSDIYKSLGEEKGSKFASSVNLLLNNQGENLSIKTLQDIRDIQKQYPDQVSRVLSTLGLTNSDLAAAIAEAENIQASRREGITSETGREAWDKAMALSGADELSGDQLQSLADKIQTIFEVGGKEGVQSFIDALDSADNIDVALEFNYEDSMDGLSADLSKRLKTLKIDKSVFDNYKEQFTAKFGEISDEAVVRWLESQKLFDKIEKDKTNIFDSLLGLNSDSILDATQIDNLVQLQEAFETLSGLDLDQSWILDNLDLLKAYVEGSNEAADELTKSFNKIRNEQNSILKLFSEYDVVAGTKMSDEFLKKLRDAGYDDETIAAYAKANNFEKDEKGNWVKQEKFKVSLSVIPEMEQVANQKHIDNDSLQQILKESGLSEEAFKQSGWHLSSDGIWRNFNNNITLGQTFSILIEEQKKQMGGDRTQAKAYEVNSILEKYGITKDQLEKSGWKLDTSSGTWYSPDKNTTLSQTISFWLNFDNSTALENAAQMRGNGTVSQDGLETLFEAYGVTEEDIKKFAGTYKIECYKTEENGHTTWHLGDFTVEQLIQWKTTGVVLNENGEEVTPSNNPDSEKTKTEKTYTRIERNTEFDVNYDSWDKLISYKEKELNRLEEAAEDLTGDALLQNLEERKKIYDEINEQREQELKQNELDIETFKKQVEALGAEIDPETGYILNERDLKKGWSDSENAIANQYNQYINEDGSLTEAGQKLGDEEINKINKSYTNYKKTVEENKQAIENYNTAFEKNIELLENSNEDLKSRAELQATQDILKVTNAYEQFSVSAAAAEEEVSKFENLLSDDKAVNERIADLTELGKKQKEELSAYESQLQGAQKAQEDLLNTLKDKNIKIDLTGNIAQDTETIKNEISSLGTEISNVEKKIKDASGDEKTQLEATLLQLLEKKEYLDQFADQWETINNDIEDTKKKIQDVNDALSTSVEEMQELSDWQTGSVDKQLETVERTLSRLQRRESRLTGQNLVNNLNKQKTIIQQQIKLEQNKLKILRQQLKTLQEQLRESLKQILVDQKISVKFEQDGSVNTTSLWNSLNANKDKISDEIRQEIVSLVNDINSKTSEINSLEDAIFGHQEDLKDMQDKIKDAVEEAAKKAMDRALEIFNAKVDFEVSIEDAWRQFDRLEAKVNGLREKSTELFQNALLDYSDAIRYVTANINSYFGEAGGGSIQILTQHVNDIMSEISIMQSGGKSSLYGIDQTTAFGDLENYYGQLMSAVEGFYDAIDSAKEKYGEAIDAIISKNEELLNDFEKIKSLQDHGISLTKLLYGEESFAQQQDYLDKQADVIQQQLEASIQQRDYYKNLLASLSPDDDNYDKVKQAYLDAMEEVYSYTEDRLNKLHDALMNQIDAQGAAIRDNLAAAAGFGSNGQMDRDWEYQTQLDEDYLDATNTQYEIDSLTNKFNEAISGTDSLAAKEKLTDVMNEQLDILNEQLEKGQKLTEYDVERANKVYELTLKQIALEEAQENKSKMRLRRDSQGNYRYEYVADQDKINKAKQDLLDAENDLYNFDKNRAKEMINSLNELLTEYYEKQKEITEDLELTEEERDAALLELQERYWGKQGLITMAKDEYLQASERMKEESVDDFSAYDDTLAASLAANWDSITQAVSENTTLLQEKARDTSEAIRETLDATTTGAEDLEGAINADTEAMAGLIEQDEELIDQYGEQIEAIQDLLLELENLEAQYRAVMDAALAAVDAALKLRQTSWETEEDEKEKAKANENDNDIGLNGNLGGNGSNNNDRYASVFISEDGFWAVANPAYNKKDLGAAIGKQFPSVQKILWESWNNEKARINKYKKKTVKYDTGGYTGAWGSEGKMAMLHEKELVLNKVDTANILQAVDIVRTLSSDLAALQNAATASSSNALIGNAPKETIEQNVKIEASFPNVTNSNEIEQAFNNLVNLASQRAMRK